MQVKIYKPAKNTMQSGRASLKGWILEGEAETPRTPEPVMGWTSSNDTCSQIRIKFPTQEAAIEFAEKEGWQYTVSQAQERKVVPKNYIDNFKYIPEDNEE